MSNTFRFPKSPVPKNHHLRSLYPLRLSQLVFHVPLPWPVKSFFVKVKNNFCAAKKINDFDFRVSDFSLFSKSEKSGSRFWTTFFRFSRHFPLYLLKTRQNRPETDILALSGPQNGHFHARSKGNSAFSGFLDRFLGLLTSERSRFKGCFTSIHGLKAHFRGSPIFAL